MGRPRTPTATLELRGAFTKNPDRGRDRENEPQPTDPIGKPPGTMSETGMIVWDELAELGFWLTSADRPTFEIACELMARFRVGGIHEKLISPTINVLSKLGFNPAERSKIKAPDTKKKQSVFANFK